MAAAAQPRRAAGGGDLWAQAWALDLAAALPRPEERHRSPSAPAMPRWPERTRSTHGSGAAPASPGRAGAGKARPSRASSSSVRGERLTGRAPAPAKTVSEPLPAEQPRPSLHIVRRRRSAAGPVLFLFLALSMVLLSPLLLNVGSMQADWRLAELEEQQDELIGERSALRARVAALSSSQRLEEQAEKLGLTPAGQVGYVLIEPPEVSSPR